MNIEFLGAARCVTGSCFLLQAGQSRVLVDCGMRQGSDETGAWSDRVFPFNPPEIDALLLTHAHIDHSGLVPLLVRQGFKGRIICTQATVDLCSIMLPDSGHIQEMEAQWHNRKRERSRLNPVEPLYTAQDARDTLGQFVGLSYRQMIDVAPHVRARFVCSGHMLGASSVEVWLTEGDTTKKIVFSGDIGTIGRPYIEDPEYLEQADIVVMESTYGDRMHGVEQSGDKRQAFLSIIRDTFKRGGNVVVPAFAVGRTQEVLYDIGRIVHNNMLPEIGGIPVVVDSPLAIEATQIFKKNMLQYYDEDAMALVRAGQDPLDFPLLRMSVTTEDSRAINNMPISQVIISASGMCEAGRIKHHLKHNLWRRESSIVFVGFQARGTLGRRIQEGAGSVRIFGEEIGVRAQIHTLQGYSGHADMQGLLDWVGAIKGRVQRVFLVHGEELSCLNLAESIRQKLALDVVAPRLLERYDLVSGKMQEIQVPPAYIPAQESVWQLEELQQRALAFMKQTDQILKGLKETDRQKLTNMISADLGPLLKKWEREIRAMS